MMVRPRSLLLSPALAHPAHVVALGFGAGLAPVAPGTFGTLLAWPVGTLLHYGYPGPEALLIVAALFLAGIWACERTGRWLGAHDHSAMVWDEFVAFLLVLVVLPPEFSWQLAGFILFRAFDIMKPPPIRWIERRFVGGFGVMIDDLAAAGCTLLCLAAASRLIP